MKYGLNLVNFKILIEYIKYEVFTTYRYRVLNALSHSPTVQRYGLILV